MLDYNYNNQPKSPILIVSAPTLYRVPITISEKGLGTHGVIKEC